MRSCLTLPMALLCIALTPALGLAADEANKPLWYGQIDLASSPTEGPELPGLFGEVRDSLSGLQKRLEKAGADEMLHGVILRFGGAGLGWSELHEMQQAIERLKQKKKRVVAWLESATTVDYLLAAACDKVYMPESGDLMVTGLRAEVTFYKNLLEKLSIETEALRVGAFKSAGEPYTRTEMSPEFREELESVMKDRYDDIVAQLVAKRKLDPAAAAKVLNEGPHNAKQALARGLIDGLGYESELPKLLAEPDRGFKLFTNYAKPKLDTDFSGFSGMAKFMNLIMGVEPQTRKSGTPRIAVIYAMGPIMTGRSTADLMGGSVMGSTTMVRAIRKARDDASVKAIVLRVDSPGGSALASDLIWHELEACGKPLVASMAGVAASGGYYISMGADKIYAEPGTITGSIGVIGMKIALEKFYEKLGMTTTVLQQGENGGVLSTLAPLTAGERTALQGMLVEIYEQFTTKAAAGRKMPVDKLEALARGRIYTGRQAKSLGLIDEVGTLDDAIAAARELAGLKPEDKFDKLILPRPASPFEALFGELNQDVRADTTLAPLAPWLPRELTDLAQQLSWWRLLARERSAVVMPFMLKVK